MVLEKTLESPLDCKEIQPVHPKEDQSWVFIGKTDAEAETPILWPPHAKSWLIGKDPDARRDWGQEEKGTTEDEMAGWHHRLNGHGFGKTPGVCDGQGGLVCCSSWGRKESDTTERLNWTELTRKQQTPPSAADSTPTCPSHQLRSESVSSSTVQPLAIVCAKVWINSPSKRPGPLLHYAGEHPHTPQLHFLHRLNVFLSARLKRASERIVRKAFFWSSGRYFSGSSFIHVYNCLWDFFRTPPNRVCLNISS